MLKLLTTISRPGFRDSDLTHDPLFGPGMTIELKQDGRFGYLPLVNGVGTMRSRDGNPNGGEWTTSLPITALLVGEFMFGSNWAYTHGEDGLFHVFDILQLDQMVVKDMPLKERRIILSDLLTSIAHPQMRACEVWPSTHQKAAELWTEYVAGKDYEGLVFKNETMPYMDTWYRVKNPVLKNYVCLGVTEGGGRNAGKLGALIGGLYVNGTLQAVCNVGGGFSDQQRADFYTNSQNYVGRVFEAKGWRLYPGGHLRHPNFRHWRDDQKPESCVLENPDAKLEYADDYE